jgi:ABC-type multidrug transport system fused ATPase/permease subunit
MPAIAGIPLGAIKLSELHQNVGVLNQDFARYQLSAKDNIGFGNLPERENQERIEQAAIAEYELFEQFRTLTKGKMTFFVSHRFSTVQLADRIVVLENSKIVEVCSHKELMTQNGLYAEMFLKQASSYNL